MPFKFGFKRARRYNVSSKNSYVVCIHLLDNSLIECTLTSESTGRDCLDNIAQRIELCQADCFGLRFVNKKLQFRWIELDKPLKKQLDKHADSPLLYFGVMFYIPSAHRIEDEMTRYQYYLQLKMDVIDGKLPCTPEQAVLLASYSVQAEFGDHEPEKHTAEYLKDFVLLPRNMTTDDRTLADLTLEIVSTHRSLQGLPPAVAELQYIIEAQKLEGYGVEYYPAKVVTAKGVDNTEVQLGTSFVGIVVKLRKLKCQEHIECFKWSDISNVTHSRRMFGVTSSVNNHTIHFQMDDPDIAKYLYKICTLHHKFYTGSRQSSLYGSQLEVSPEVGARGPLPDIQQSSQPPLDITDGPCVAEQPGSQNQMDDMNQAACLYQTPTLTVDHPQCTSLGPNYPDANAFSDDQPIVDMQYGNGQIYQMMVGADIPTIPPVPAVAAPHQHYVQNAKYANNRSAALPAYRPSPAYETVMRQRLEHLQPAMPDAHVIDPRHQDLAGNIHLAQVYMRPETMAYSQPEIGRVPPPYMQYLAQMGRVDEAYTNRGADMNYGVDRMPRPVDRACSLIIYPTYGTPPDVSGPVPQSQYSASEHLINETLMNQYKPPPPYPHHINNSSSTPDLATIQTSHSNLSSSPDLVSRKNIGNGGATMMSLLCQSQLDQSIENLAFDTQNLNIGHKMAQQAREMSVPSDGNNDSSSVEIFIVDPPMQYPPQHAPLQYSQSDVSGLERSIELRLGQTAYPGGNFHNQRMPSQSSPESVASSHVSDITEPSVELLPEGASSKTQDMEECDDMKVKQQSMGPMKVAALHGLTVARGSILDLVDSENRVPVDDRRQSLEGRLEEDQVFAEFDNIPKKRVRWNCGIAEAAENRCRNRFNDVLPYDDCSVKLKPSKDNKNGYINASHLRVDVVGEEWLYIATQAPLPNTLSDFWQMVWEQEVHVIAMLTALEEAGKTKCHMYWPRQPGPQNKVRYGDFVVTLRFSTSSRSYITRGFDVRDMRSGCERLVWHLQYTDWPDHGCPDNAQAFLIFLDELESVRRHVSMEDGTGRLLPTLVHCSAGVGRTGVLILVELVKACLQHNQNIDIPATLERLRMQRMHLVQTISQYRFVYKALVQYLKNLRLI